MNDIRVRFCPSPTGNPHVGMIRTALFNWAFARHVGGTFVFRIEDTDAARDSQDSYEALVESMRWLGLDWDEGPEVGGGHGPYRQSERMEIYADVVHRLIESGFAYRCYCSAGELDAKREIAAAQKRTPGYDGTCRELSREQVEIFVAEGRQPVVRYRMPGTDFTWNDLVRGELSFPSGARPRFCFGQGKWRSALHLGESGRRCDDANHTCAARRRPPFVDSAAAGLIRGAQGILVSPKETPAYGHLPYVMGEGNKKLSKRDPESSLAMYRAKGYLPEALLNYLALLGWSMGNDLEFFSPEELTQAFTVERVNPNPARFDLKKCTSINGDWIRHLEPTDLLERLVPFLESAGVSSMPITSEERDRLVQVIPLIQERLDTLGAAPELIAFLFTTAAQIDIDPDLWTSESAQVLQYGRNDTRETARCGMPMRSRPL